jgi:hypothetical protein
MATITPPNLYTAGNVVFNTQPSTNFAIQLLQQKKAKDEALEQYYQKLPQTINEAGMRDNERPKFMQQISDLQAYWRDNRDAIKNARKDGGAAQYNYEKKFREIRELVDASKQLAKDDLELGKQWWDPNKRYIFRNNQIVDRISKHNIPYGEPGHERLDLYSLTQPPKPRTVADWQQLNKTLTDGLQLGETPTGKVEDLGNFKKRHYILKQHSEQNLKTIGEKALAMYGTDYDWQGEADAQYEEALKNPKALEPYNQVYQQVMKRPIKNAGDLFAAQRIVEQSKAVEDYKDEVDRKAEIDYRNRTSMQQKKDYALWRKRVGLSEGNGSGGQDAGGWVSDAAQAAQGGDAAQIESVFAFLSQGSGKVFKGVKVADGKLVVSYENPRATDEFGLTKGGERFSDKIDIASPYLKDQLVGLYQRIMGADAKVEKVPYYKKRENDNPKPAAAPAQKKDPAKAISKDKWRSYSVADRQELIKNGYYVQ